MGSSGLWRSLKKDFSAVLISILVDCDGELFGSSLIRFRQLNTEVFELFLAPRERFYHTLTEFKKIKVGQLIKWENMNVKYNVINI